MKKITVLTTALLLCGPMMAQTNSTYDAQFIDWPTYSGDDLELNVDSKGTAFRKVVARDGKICLDNTLGTVTSPEVQVSPRSALIMHR